MAVSSKPLLHTLDSFIMVSSFERKGFHKDDNGEEGRSLAT